MLKAIFVAALALPLLTAALIECGVDARAIDVAAAGDAGEVERCAAQAGAKAALAACLLPNRRGEVTLIAVKER
jgi:hypothetical protein